MKTVSNVVGRFRLDQPWSDTTSMNDQIVDAADA
jgi:hypothetical protein